MTSFLITSGALALLVASTVSCGHWSRRARPDGSQASSQASSQARGSSERNPASTRVNKMSFRPWSEIQLSNGLKVFLFEDNSLAYFSLALVTEAGALRDPKDKAGLAAMTANTLIQGTQRLDAQALADELSDFGIAMSVNPRYEGVVLSLGGVSMYRAEILRLFSEVVLSPAFAPDEVNRVRKNLLAERRRLPDQGEAFADRAFAGFLYGERSYGGNASGTLASLPRIKRKDVIQFYLKNYRPNSSYLAVVGQYPPNIKEDLEKALGRWRPKDVSALAAPEFDESPKPLELITKAGLNQSFIQIGHLGVAAKDPDEVALKLANFVLGGGQNSLLLNKVRGELGLTYGISSEFSFTTQRGDFSISTFTRLEKTAEAIEQIRKIFSDFVARGITDEQLARAKGFFKGSMPLEFATAESFASAILRLRLYGYPDNTLSEMGHRIDKTTLEQVNAAIVRHLHPDKLKILVYSDPKVKLSLEKLGPVVTRKFTDLL